MINKFFAVILCLFMFTGCSPSASINDYAQTQPALDFQQFFTGPMTAYGIVQNRFTGKVTRKFTAELDGTWQGESGTLDEVFRFDDGDVWNRQWRIQTGDNGQFTATADDVNGQAVGKTAGSVVHWTYDMNIPVDGETYSFAMDDWMYKVDEQTLINKTDMRKFGVTVAKMTIVIHKEGIGE